MLCASRHVTLKAPERSVGQFEPLMKDVEPDIEWTKPLRPDLSSPEGERPVRNAPASSCPDQPARRGIRLPGAGLPGRVSRGRHGKEMRRQRAAFALVEPIACRGRRPDSCACRKRQGPGPWLKAPERVPSLSRVHVRPGGGRGKRRRRRAGRRVSRCEIASLALDVESTKAKDRAVPLEPLSYAWGVRHSR